MRLVSEKLEIDSKLCAGLLQQFKTASCAKVLLSKCITIGLQKMRAVLLGVPIVVSWLVLVGVNECILIKVQWYKILEKPILSLFGGCFFVILVVVFLLGSMSAFSQKSCLSGLVFEDSLIQDAK